MEYIKAVTFIGAKAGKYAGDISKESLLIMKEKTGCNAVILNIGAFQDTAQSEYVDFRHEFIPTDQEMIDMITYIKKRLGLKVILKPVVNCKDGTWRAYINFFEIDVVCEPKWSNWFRSYTEFQRHYAGIAEQTNCEMLMIGSDMVQTEKKDVMWRNLIDEIRQEYTGLISYSADKYQEENVEWWDAVDVISTCAYYPQNDFANQLNRLEKLSVQYQKPLMLSEFGCKSTAGAAALPNRWTLQGPLSMEEQEDYFKTAFDACRGKEFIGGIGIWNWSYNLPEYETALRDKGYTIYLKPVCNLIYNEWKE